MDIFRGEKAESTSFRLRCGKISKVKNEHLIYTIVLYSNCPHLDKSLLIGYFSKTLGFLVSFYILIMSFTFFLEFLSFGDLFLLRDPFFFKLSLYSCRCVVLPFLHLQRAWYLHLKRCFSCLWATCRGSHLPAGSSY